MGAYIYRLKGSKAFTLMKIDGQIQRVYDYVYWYKPYYAGMFESEPKWMKPIRMLDARLRNAFAKVEPVKWVRHVNDMGEKDDYIMEWPGGISISDYNERYQTARRIPVSDLN